MSTTNAERYTSVAKALHWAIAILIVGQLIGGFVMHNLEFSQIKVNLYQLHKSFGLTVLMLALFRLYWRLTHKAPALSPDYKRWERVLARVTHVAFYVLIIAIPLAGWIMVSASEDGFPTEFFFLFDWPDLPVAESEAAEEFWVEIHELLAKLTIGLLVLHVAGALKHHLMDKDRTLFRMLPSALSRRMSPAEPRTPNDGAMSS